MIRNRQADIHAVKAGDDGGHHQNHRDRRQKLHHHIEIIGDDRCERIHHLAQDVAGDLAHRSRLTILREHVVEQIFVLAAQLQEFPLAKSLQDRFVLAQGNRKVDQALLISQQLQDFAVLEGTLQAVLESLDNIVDCIQAVNVRARHAKQQMQDKTGRLRGGQVHVMKSSHDTHADSVVYAGTAFA